MINADTKVDDRFNLKFEDDNLQIWKHDSVWIDFTGGEGQLCWQCKYCRHIYTELFSTDMIYRHLLCTEIGDDNADFNCKQVPTI